MQGCQTERLIVSVHVPKSAGSTFMDALRTIFEPDQVVLDNGDTVLDPAAPFNADPAAWRKSADEFVRRLSPSTRLVHGHFSAMKYRDRRNVEIITWVRNPVRRLISHYYFWKEMPDSPHTLHQAVRGGMRFEEFVQHPLLQNIVTRTFLRGVTLRECAFVGVQEHYAEDFAALRRMMGWERVPVPEQVRNANPRPGYREDVAKIVADQALVRRIERLNGEDIEFYESALQARRRRLRKTVGVFRSLLGSLRRAAGARRAA